MQLSRSRVQSLLFTVITVVSKRPHRSATRATTTAAAEAFQPLSILTLPSSNYHRHHHRHRQSTNISIPFRGGSSLSLASSSSSSSSGVNGESQNKKNQEKKTNSSKNLEGQTGWNHNLPKETSSFWKSSSSSSSSSSEEDEGYTVEKEEPRTGWLHNTKSKKAQPRSGATEKSKDKDDSSRSGSGSGSGSGESKAQKLLRMAKLKQKVNHRMVSPPVFHPCGEGRRVVVTEHYISVPLKYGPSPATSNGGDVDLDANVNADQDQESIDVYFSIVDLVSTAEEESFFRSLQSTATDIENVWSQTKVSRLREQQKRADQYKEFLQMKDANQCILYLQGGPGFGAPQPINGIGLGDKSSWVGAALGKGYKRVVLMDQRGTGKSTTITKQTLEKKFPDLFQLDDKSPRLWICSQEDISSMESVNKELDGFDETEPELASAFRAALSEAKDYMTHFRADNIVRDAESIKDALLLPVEDEENTSPRPWGAALGQSFGGFCMMTYLSLIPNPPKICLLTGGIAPMLTNIDDVYCALRERVKKRNFKYYERYPGDVYLVKRIVKKLIKEPAQLPSGGLLTARRFLQLGISLGGSPSSFASMHSLFSSAFLSEDDDDFTRAFLKTIDTMQPFDDHPIYFLLHESIYVDKNSNCEQSDWSAMKAYDCEKDFDCTFSTEEGENGRQPTLLSGEVVFPWMVDGDYAELSGLSMRALAHSISSKNDWDPLYNSEQMRKALATDGTGVSKAAAAVYYDDMYVDFDASMKVTERGNPLENCAVWVNNDFQHSGLRDDGAAIFCKLLGMAKGEIGTPS